MGNCIVTGVCGFCFLKVRSGEVGILERWGKFDRVVQPGLAGYCCCCAEQIAGKLSTRVQQIEVPCDTKTIDDVFIRVMIAVQYELVEGSEYAAFYELTDLRDQMGAYVFDVIRSQLPKMKLDDVFVQKQQIAESVKDQLREKMASFGYQIINVLVIDTSPDMQVRAAMNEINAQQRLRVAASERAEADKFVRIKKAEAEAEAKYLDGIGLARQRQAIADGMQDSVKTFHEVVPETHPSTVMNLLLLSQYFDTLTHIGKVTGHSTMYIPSAPGAMRHVANCIREGFQPGSRSTGHYNVTMSAPKAIALD